MTEQRTYILESPPGPEVIINGKSYLYFAGTGYFQLQDHPELLQAAQNASLKYGMGSATTRTMAGTTPTLVEIELEVAVFFGTEEAAYLPSGYLTNMAGLNALNDLGLYDMAFVDEGSHYSLMDGLGSTGKKVIPFRHLDVQDLKEKLSGDLKDGQKPLIASDGLFPVWAKVAPVDHYVKLADQYQGLVWIDDAHGVGILGKHGRGTPEYLKVSSDKLYMGATLSKAFGAYGGIIPGPAGFIKRIREGNVMTGSSSPLHGAMAAGIQGLKLVEAHPEWRERLRKNARYLKQGLASMRIPVDQNDLPIVAFEWGDAVSMSRLQQALMEEGIFIQYGKYKGAGTEGVLRIVVFSTHAQDQLDTLIHALEKHL